MEKKGTIRPKLTSKEAKVLHDALDELIILHNSSSPDLGKKSEKDKLDKAFLTLEKMAFITNTLSLWAESHIIGLTLNPEKQDDDTSHSHEIFWRDYPFEKFWNDSVNVEGQRKAMQLLLLRSSGWENTIPFNWRKKLAYALDGLNKGQVQKLLAPSNVKRQGRSQDLDLLRRRAVLHVCILSADRKKMSALNYVAQSIGVKSEEVIKDWEKQLIRIMPENKVIFKSVTELQKIALLPVDEKVKRIAELVENIGEENYKIAKTYRLSVLNESLEMLASLLRQAGLKKPKAKAKKV